MFSNHIVVFFLFCFLNAVIKAGGDISMLLIKGNQLVWKSKGEKVLERPSPDTNAVPGGQLGVILEICGTDKALFLHHLNLWTHEK